MKPNVSNIILWLVVVVPEDLFLEVLEISYFADVSSNVLEKERRVLRSAEPYDPDM